MSMNKHIRGVWLRRSYSYRQHVQGESGRKAAMLALPARIIPVENRKFKLLTYISNSLLRISSAVSQFYIVYRLLKYVDASFARVRSNFKPRTCHMLPGLLRLTGLSKIHWSDERRALQIYKDQSASMIVTIDLIQDWSTKKWLND